MSYDEHGVSEGTEWVHRGTGDRCIVTDLVRVEHPETHLWLDGVEYRSTYDADMRHYVRTLARFLERFERVKG